MILFLYMNIHRQTMRERAVYGYLETRGHLPQITIKHSVFLFFPISRHGVYLKVCEDQRVFTCVYWQTMLSAAVCFRGARQKTPAL